MATEYLQHKKKLKGIRYMLLAIALINALISIAFKVIASFKGELIPMYLPSMLVGLFAYIIPIMIYAKINNIYSINSLLQMIMEMPQQVLV